MSDEHIDPAQKLYKESKAAKEIKVEIDSYAMWSFGLSLGPVFSLMLSVLAFIVAPFVLIGLIVSVILGILSISRINQNKKLKGKGFAIAGITLSSLQILFGIFGFLFFAVQVK